MTPIRAIYSARYVICNEYVCSIACYLQNATIHLAAYHLSWLVLFKLHVALLIYYYTADISKLVCFVAFSTETLSVIRLDVFNVLR